MIHVVPDYYGLFRCTAGSCNHSCCIGWEIDVDEQTLDYYDSLSGEMGERLRNAISREGQPHFVLGEGERCPFLNGQGLCDLILELGEGHLCSICADHPRFRNELPGRVETGLGLCCEEAGRLILGRAELMSLCSDGDMSTEDWGICLRDEVIACLQNRSRTVPQRVAGMLELCHACPPEGDMDLWVQRFLGLERLDDAWTRALEELKEGWRGADLTGFDMFMARRQTEYEQFLVYLVYRHLANAFCAEEAAARAAFAALGYKLLYLLGALHWTKTGELSLKQQVEFARMFSSEIEYSLENMDCLLDLLAGEMLVCQ